MNARFAAVWIACSLLVGVRFAHAEAMDPALERLVLNGDLCRTAEGAIREGGEACQPDNAAFKNLINQWGFFLAPSAMHSARTTGFGGLVLSVEANYTKISDDQDYWRRGTQGARDATTNRASTFNSTPASILQLYSAKVRKGFGLGFELTGTVGYVPKTSLFSGGADVRWALLEGFRSGVLGAFPDLAVGAGVRTLTGTPQFQLTVVGLDTQISKPFTIHSSSVITPWIGYQHLWIFGDSGLIDFTPATDAFKRCGFAGNNVPGNLDPRKTVADGQPICTKGDTADFNNNMVFERARLKRHRAIVGVTYRFEMIHAGAQFITDLTDPADAQTDDATRAALNGQARQFSLMFELGAAF